jgi:hypothetical protein
MRLKVAKHDCIMYIDNTKLSTNIFLGAIFGLVLIGEFVSITLVHVTTFRLRLNASIYSENTRRLHMQFTILLGIQVELKELLQNLLIISVIDSGFLYCWAGMF